MERSYRRGGNQEFVEFKIRRPSFVKVLEKCGKLELEKVLEKCGKSYENNKTYKEIKNKIDLFNKCISSKKQESEETKNEDTICVGRPSDSAMSGSQKSSSRIVLSDIGIIISEDVTLRKEKTPVEIPKPRVPILRSKSSSRKRKAVETVDVESFDGLEHGETLKKMNSLLHMGIEQLEKSYQEKLDELEGLIEDIKKVVAAKNKILESEVMESSRLRKASEEMEAKHTQAMEEVMEDAKKSAAITVIQARSKMAEEAGNKEFDFSAWDVSCPGLEKDVGQFGR